MQNLPYEAILGSDFLVEKDAAIDLKNKCISLADKSSKLKEPSVPKSERVMATSRPLAIFQEGQTGQIDVCCKDRL